MNRFFLLISALLITQWSYSQIHEFGLMVGGSNFIGDVGSTSYIAPKNTAFGGVINGIEVLDIPFVFQHYLQN